MAGRTKRHFMPETKLEVVQRYMSGESPGALGREYEIRPTLVHQWAVAYRGRGVEGLRRAGRPSMAEALADLVPEVGAAADEAAAKVTLLAAQRRIAALEQKVGRQQLEIDFFKLALQQVETLCPPATRSGTTASTPLSGRGRSSKAD